MKNDNGGAAYPVEMFDPDDGSHTAYPGMSVLDWFAGQALANPEIVRRALAKERSPTEESYRIADTMIAEKRRREQGDATT